MSESEAVFVSEERDRSVDMGYWRKQVEFDGRLEIVYVQDVPSTWSITHAGYATAWVPHVQACASADLTHRGYRLHRDPIRKGWWVAKEGVRYVAVEGVPEGQRAAKGSRRWVTDVADGLNGGKCAADRHEWFVAGHHGWAVIDLHGLGPEKEGRVVGVDWGKADKTEHRMEWMDRNAPRYDVVRCVDVGEGRRGCHVGPVDRDRALEYKARVELGQEAMTTPLGHCTNGTRDCWCVVDLRDAWSKPSPRYVVLTAEEMRGMEGRKCDPLGKQDLKKHEASAWVAMHEEGTRQCGYRWGEETRSWVTCAIVDTQDGWGLSPRVSSFTLTEPHEVRISVGKGHTIGSGERITLKAGKREVLTTGPSDAEIVELWDTVMLGCELSGAPFDRYDLPLVSTRFTATFAEYQAARSRELKRRVREAEERRRLPVECQAPGENEGGEVESLAGAMDPFSRDWA
jgi:hypothetical protein